ncbi:MAG: anthranilate synthase component I family protein [Planctomycetota bacterium]
MSLTTCTTKKSIVCKVHYKKICKPINYFALTELFSSLESVSILGGNQAEAKTNRFSYWCCEPVDVFELNTNEKEPFSKLNKALTRYKINHSFNASGELPKEIFKGGWVGYFSYELGKCIERLPELTLDDLEMPLIRLCFYDKVICADRLEGTCRLIVLEMENDHQGPEEKLKALEKLLVKSQQIQPVKPHWGNIEGVDPSKIPCNMDKECYIESVEEIRRQIYDGNVYQVNFSQRFECAYNARPIELYHWQNYYNPGCYAAYIDSPHFRIVSASPEMFLTITDDTIKTKPIKGTRPRIYQSNETSTETNLINSQNYNELLGSGKEQAELNMIIDLERNDLGRICQYGTIKVTQPRTIEAYPTVFHTVATVEGNIREKICFCDILKAMFPGGSITGAPKISSMETIERLEPTARGVYTGAIGFIGIDGNACLNIAIRTIIIKSQKAFAQTGGGIVADSIAEDEWEETIVKARALLAGIKAIQKEV